MPRKSLHPTFQKKRVLELLCRFCGNIVCNRGMKAILLADTAVELFSTDIPPVKYVSVIFYYLHLKLISNMSGLCCLILKLNNFHIIN